MFSRLVSSRVPRGSLLSPDRVSVVDILRGKLTLLSGRPLIFLWALHYVALQWPGSLYPWCFCGGGELALGGPVRRALAGRVLGPPPHGGMARCSGAGARSSSPPLSSAPSRAAWPAPGSERRTGRAQAPPGPLSVSARSRVPRRPQAGESGRAQPSAHSLGELVLSRLLPLSSGLLLKPWPLEGPRAK